LIRNNPRYENALGTGSDVAGFASALQEGGYATDPNYARKVESVAREIRALTTDEHIKPAANGRREQAGVRS
jgi:flagellum-specific peptidoglycan hydrolase FlgJ